MIYVSHDRDEVDQLADRVIVLQEGPRVNVLILSRYFVRATCCFSSSNQLRTDLDLICCSRLTVP